MMNKKLLAGLAIGVIMLSSINGIVFANTFQDFEDGLLTGWSVGGRQSGTGNWWGVSDYAGSKMGYLQHRSFTELTLSKSFVFSPNMILSFDAEFSINGDTSPTASGSLNFYDMVNYWITLYDVNSNLLKGSYYGAATTTFPYNNNSTYPTPIIEFRPNGLQHYEYDITRLASDLGVAIDDVKSFTLVFNGYSSWWSGSNMIVRFDNISTGSPVPEPSTLLLFGMGIVGLAGTRLRRKKQ